ncbi:MAG: hypothetical protein O4861_21565 [Trichodesmium sp. St16_bin4-tuft]|nr:hypothetical protein [Trichodesmium sp. St16_bin4-tuft]
MIIGEISFPNALSIAILYGLLCQSNLFGFLVMAREKLVSTPGHTYQNQALPSVGISTEESD